MLVIVSTSLRPGSHSRILGQEAVNAAAAAGIGARFVDMAHYPLPQCDGGANSSDQAAQDLDAFFRAATALVFCTPIYNYDVSPVLRNLIAHAGESIEGKVVGLLCAAGGERSYLAPLAFMTSLMSHFRCLVLPRYAYAPEKAFHEGQVIDEEIKVRVREVVFATHNLAQVALRAQTCEVSCAA